MRKLQTLLAGALLAIIAVVCAPAAAFAIPSFDAAPSTSLERPIEDDAADSATADTAESDLITINRWKSAASGFVTNIGMSDGNSLMSEANRSGVQSMFMSTGNMWWDAATTTTTLASGMDVFAQMAHTVDSVAESLVTAFIGTGGFSPLSIILVVAVIMAFFQVVRVNRGAGLFKRLLSLAVIVGYIMFAASAITGPNAPSKQTPETYRPSIATPSWLVSVANSGVDKLGNLSAAVTLDATKNPMSLAAAPAGKPMSCVNTLSAFEHVVAKSEDRDVQVRAMVDRMWQMTGLRTWISTQMGAKNGVGNDVFCYLLDLKSSELTAADTLQMYQLTATHSGLASSFPGWEWTTGDNATRSIPKLSMLEPESNRALYGAVTAMAACNWDGEKFSGRSGFYAAGAASESNLGFNPKEGQASNAGTDSVQATGAGYGWGLDSTNIAQACQAAFAAPSQADWWTGEWDAESPSVSGNNLDPKMLSAFVMPGNSGSIDYKVQGPRTTNFISNFYGTDAWGGTFTTVTFATLAPFATLPIILFALVTLFLKLVLVFSIIALWVAVVAAVFAENPWQDRLKTPVIMSVTTAFLATGMSIILGLLLVFSQAIASVGMALSFTGPVATVLVASISPLAACFSMHFLWKKAFPGAPSPLSLKGMQAWAKGAPMAASAVAAGAGGFLGGTLGSVVRGGARQIGGSVVDKVTGRGGASSGRKSSMGGGDMASREVDDSLVSEDVMVAKAQIAAGRKLQRAENVDAAKARTRSMYRGARANLVLATTPEGREKLRETATERLTAARKGAGRALSGAGSKMAEGIGLSKETRDRIALETAGESATTRRFAMLSQSTAHVGAAAGRSAKKMPAAAHRTVMRSAGPDATAKQAYARFGRQAALVAATAVVPGTTPFVLAGVAASNTNRSWKSRKAERAAAQEKEIHQLNPPHG